MSKHAGGWNTKRRDPYTETGIKRLKCIRCGGKAEYQWNICSDNNFYRPICGRCDILLNKAVLDFMKHPNSDHLINVYVEKKRMDHASR